MAETVNDIVGKGFAYEERVEVTRLFERPTGTIAGFAGVANWGPVNVPTKVYKNFEKYFGTEINRDKNAKEYSGLVATRFLKQSESCLFTRVSDGSEQKASKVIMKLAKPATIIGNERISGRSVKITSACNKYITSIDGNSDLSVTVSLTPRTAPIVSSVLPTSLSDPLAANFSVGDYFEFYVDGILYQHIISSASSILCNILTLDDASFGGKSGANVINYVDRLLYALRNTIIGTDNTYIIRKVDTNKISLNSAERGASSTIRINAFPIVFPSATVTNPTQSVTNNSTIESIVSQINDAIMSQGTSFINSSGKYQTQSNTEGLSSSIVIKSADDIDFATDFVGNALLDAGDFSTAMTGKWIQLTESFVASLSFFKNETANAISSVAGINATKGYQETSATFVGGDVASVPTDDNYELDITIDGSTEQLNDIDLQTTDTWANVIIAIQTSIDSAFGSGIATVALVGGKIRITSETEGAASTVLISSGTSTGLKDLLTELSIGTLETPVDGIDATQAYNAISFPTAIVGTDKSVLPAGTYKLNINVDGDGAADINIVLEGNENYNQVASIIGTAITGGHAAVVDGAIRIYTDTYGTSGSIAVVDGAGTAGISISIVDNKAVLASLITTKIAQKLAQRFTVSSENAYSKYELYTTLLSSASDGIIKMVVYKDGNVIYSKTILQSDISNGLLRASFYVKEAGSYIFAFVANTENTVSITNIDNLYSGPYRETVSNDLLNALAIKSSAGAYDLTDQIAYGQDANLNMGRFEAYYAGEDGNRLRIQKITDNNSIEQMIVTMGSDILAKIANFSYTVNDPMFFGNLINNNMSLDKYIKYVLPEPAPLSIDTIPDAFYQLSGGTSGIENVDDTQIAIALDAYKNLDIFDVDMICIPGNSTQIVREKIQDVCEYRKDCFGIFDPPEYVAGKPGGIPTGGVDSMIYWHNGQIPALLPEKLDSKYISTYFPWVLVDVKSNSNAQQWHAPSITILPMLARSDREYTPYVAPAGTKAYLDDILDIAYYLTEEEKGRMYDDIVGNNINAIVYTTRQGFFVDGQKTTQRERNAYNRINVMRVSLFIKRKLMDIVPNFFYEPITAAVREEFKEVITKDIMKVLVASNAIKNDYSVIIDSSINTPEVVASGGLIAIISFSPIKALEKIKVISIMKDEQVIVQF